MKALGEPVAELIGAGVDPDLGRREAKDDLPVQSLKSLNIGQVNLGQDTILARARQGDS